MDEYSPVYVDDLKACPLPGQTKQSDQMLCNITKILQVIFPKIATFRNLRVHSYADGRIFFLDHCQNRLQA